MHLSNRHEAGKLSEGSGGLFGVFFYPKEILMNKLDVKKLTAAAMLTAVGVMLPSVTGGIPQIGTMLLHWLSPFYVLCCFNQIYSGALRGAGNSRAPMIIMLTSFVAFRQVYLFIMSRLWNEIIPIAMSYPAGWLLCSTLTAIYYHSVKLGKNRLVEDERK